MRVAVVDTGGANVASVSWALQRAGGDPFLTADADEIRRALRVVLPGVRAAGSTMRVLRERGLDDVLRSVTQPLIGFCLGMQLLYEHSEEGDVDCLGLIPGRVRRLEPADGIRVPHLGWNVVTGAAGREDRAYFVHSYAADVTDDTVLRCTHGRDFTAQVRRGNVGGMQFHPERSGPFGAQLLREFIEHGGER